MFRRYDSSVADLTVEVAGQPLYPGDLLDAEVVVTPRRSFVATLGLAKLSQKELLRIDSAREAIPSGPLGRRRRDRGQQGPFSVDVGFVKDAEMEAGVTYRYPVQLRLPLQAPPTVKGKHAHITWELSAYVEAKADWAPNTEGLLANLTQVRVGNDTRELVVFARADSAALGGERLPATPVATQDYRQVQLEIELLTGQVANGGTVAGTLRVRPRESFAGRELRVELSRWERCGNRQSRTVEDVQVFQRPARLIAGDETTWEFRLQVPDRLTPSVLAQHTFVGWQVKASVARRLRPDLNVAQLIQVITSP